MPLQKTRREKSSAEKLAENFAQKDGIWLPRRLVGSFMLPDRKIIVPQMRLPAVKETELVQTVQPRLSAYSPSTALPYMADHLQQVLDRRKTLSKEKIEQMLNQIYSRSLVADRMTGRTNTRTEAQTAKLRGNLAGFLENWEPGEEARIRSAASHNAQMIHDLLIGRHAHELQEDLRLMAEKARKTH